MSSSSGGWLTRAPQVCAGDKPKTLKHVIYVKDVSERPKTPKLRHVKDECQHVFFAVLPKKVMSGPRVYMNPRMLRPSCFYLFKHIFSSFARWRQGLKV